MASAEMSWFHAFVGGSIAQPASVGPLAVGGGGGGGPPASAGAPASSPPPATPASGSAPPSGPCSTGRTSGPPQARSATVSATNVRIYQVKQRQSGRSTPNSSAQASRLIPLPEDARAQNTEFVTDHHRHRHQSEIERIPGRRHECRDDDVHDDRVPAILAEELVVDDAHHREQRQDQRQLEDDRER